MTEISEAAKLKACELAIQKGSGAGRDFDGPGGLGIYASGKALAEYIQQVSDAAKSVRSGFAEDMPPLHRLDPFILVEPVDPLVDALRSSVADPEAFAYRLRVNLEARGLKIVEADK